MTRISIDLSARLSCSGLKKIIAEDIWYVVSYRLVKVGQDCLRTCLLYNDTNVYGHIFYITQGFQYFSSAPFTIYRQSFFYLLKFEQFSLISCAKLF